MACQPLFRPAGAHLVTAHALVQYEFSSELASSESDAAEVSEVMLVPSDVAADVLEPSELASSESDAAEAPEVRLVSSEVVAVMGSTVVQKVFPRAFVDGPLHICPRFGLSAVAHSAPGALLFTATAFKEEDAGA